MKNNISAVQLLNAGKYNLKPLSGRRGGALRWYIEPVEMLSKWVAQRAGVRSQGKKFYSSARSHVNMRSRSGMNRFL